LESPGTVIAAREFPRYFAALEESRVVAAEDASRDSRTSEFAEPYLRPLGIASMMDAPIRLHGALVGVVCHEHVGSKREWPLEDAETVREIIATPPPEASGNQHEHSWITRNGARPFIAWSITPLRSREGVLRYSVITAIDISQRKALEEQLIHDAFHDSLTGL